MMNCLHLIKNPIFKIIADTAQDLNLSGYVVGG